MSSKKKNHPEKTWPTQSARAELAAITVNKRACDWATEVTWTVSYTAWATAEKRSCVPIIRIYNPPINFWVILLATLRHVV